jgi:exopolysaccharide biosynthesis polyprenyl glycosylphosphotransferase
VLRILKQYYPARNAVFVIGESIMILVAVLLASTILLGIDWLSFNVIFSRKAVFIAVVFQASLYYNDLYDISSIHDTGALASRLLRALGFATIVVGLFYFIFPDIIIAPGVFATSALFVMVLAAIWRFAYNTVLKRGWFNQNIIILGSGDMAKSIVEEIRKRKDCGYHISLIIQEDNHPVNFGGLRTEVVSLDRCASLSEKAKELDVKKIVVALSDKRRSFPVRELLTCRTEGIPILEGQSFFEMLAGRLIVDQLNPSWLIFREGFKKTRNRLFFKRLRDILYSVSLLIVCLPLNILAAVLIKIWSPGPLFSIQSRIGENLNSFEVYRFRIFDSPAADDRRSGPTDDEQRQVTTVGKILRTLHIDALPQLWNVLKGDMSLIGPRPDEKTVAEQLEKSIPYYSAKFTVKPGITGWSQVNYPFGASIEDARQMLNYDLFYIKNVSFLMDMMIIMRTIKVVFLAKPYKDRKS